MNKYIGIVVSVALASSMMFAADGPKAKKHPARKTAAKVTKVESSREIEELKQQLAAQQQAQKAQFDTLQQSNAALAEQLKQTQQQLNTATGKINAMETEERPAVTRLTADVAEVKQAQAETSTKLVQQEKKTTRLENATTLHYKGITIKPGGFISFDALYRRNAINTDIATAWTAAPYSNAPMARLGEFRATSRLSRISVEADGKLGNADLTGYFEIDFLGTGYGANENCANGYSDRIRQFWTRVAFKNGFSVTAGQMPSLFTTNRKGIENLGEWMTPFTDGNVFIAHDYVRQSGIRVVKYFDNKKIAAAFAAENAATVSVNPSNVANLSGLATTGVGALSNTTYSTNRAPDLIAKVAYDPGFGHYEIKAIGRVYRDRVMSTPTTPGQSNTVFGGGIGGAIYLPVVPKKLDWMTEGSFGSVGRYGSSGIDAVIKPNGNISPERGIHALTTLEFHATPKLELYAIGATEYLYRNYGYGAPTVDNSKCFLSESAFSCSAHMRSISGGSTGLWYTFYKGPIGAVRYGFNWSYYEKTTWAGIGGAPKATDSQFEATIRYILP